MSLFNRDKKKNVELEKTTDPIIAKRKAARDKAANAVAEDLKMETEEAVKIVDEAVTRLKDCYPAQHYKNWNDTEPYYPTMNYVDLRIGKFWRLPEEKQESAYAKYLKARKEKKRRNKEIEKLNVNKICEQSGWDYDTAKAAVMDAKKRTGCLYKEYIMFNMWDKTPQQQSEYFLYIHSLQIFRKYNSPMFSNITTNKMLTAMLFSKYMRRAWSMNYGVEFSKFEEKFKGCQKVVYKPQAGSQGTGIQVIDISGDNMREAYDRIFALPKGIVEEFVHQHPQMQKINPSSVNTIRFVTISWMEKDELVFKNVYAATRIGNGGQVDNMHAGGMAAVIDLETGTICTDAVDNSSKVYKVHPATNVQIKGFQIPCFDEIKEFVEGIVRSNRIIGYIGWDIAVAEDGPILIEINSQPGAASIQLPYALMENKGMKSVIAEYLDEDTDKQRKKK